MATPADHLTRHPGRARVKSAILFAKNMVVG
jgi:hypothetical protein